MNSEKNVFQNIRVIIFVSQVWGLVPRTTGNKFKRFALFAYSTTVTIFYVYVCFVYNTFTFEQIDKAATNVKLLVKIIYVETTLRCVLLLVILLINWVQTGKFLQILTKLINFDTLLKRKLHAEIPNEQNYIFQIVYAGYIIFFGVYYCAQLYANNNGFRLSVQWAALSNVNLIILSQFTILIHAFTQRFKIFNTFFMNMNMFPSLNDSKTKNYFDYSRINAPRYRNLNILSRLKLKELHIIYLTMRDLLHEINSYYSFQVLLIVCETVAILIASISTLTFNSDNFVTMSTQRYLTLLHCGFRLFSVAVLIHVAEQTSSEAKRTVIIIHNFLKGEQNTEVKKGLELFLLDLWHHKVKFDAHDFFDLDYQLIQSILSAATTYVIVLIQFQLATTSLTPKYTSNNK